VNRLSGTKIDIQGLSQGDREVFRRAYVQYYNMLYHLCMEYIHNQQVAQELVQDTFMKLWEIRRNLNSDTNLANFLYTVAKNKCLNYLREQQTIRRAQNSRDYLESHFSIEALQESGDHWIHFNELEELIRNAIGRMPPGINKAFILSRYDGLKYKEIAQKLNISVKTVEVRISKALAILRKAVRDFDPSAL